MTTSVTARTRSSKPDRATDTPAGLMLKLALVAVGAGGVAGWLVLAVAHLGDRYHVGHVQGAWMALAQYANEGTLYPPLFDGVRYGGTRWMPIPVLVNAAAARLTGEYLVSGKAVAILLFAAVLVMVFVVLRQLRCPRPVAVALTGLVAATGTGLSAGSTIGGDVLPVLLQLGALLAVGAAVRRGGVGWMLAAGVLAGLAVVSKLTGVWAALAVLSWLGIRKDWRRLGWFSGAGGITVAVTLGVVQWVSEGRFLETFLTLTLAGTGGPVGWVRAPNQLMLFGLSATPAVWIVVPLAALGWLAARRAGEVTVHHHALGWSLLLTLVVYTDMGAGLNHMLDLAVLTVVAVGYLASRLPFEELGAPVLVTALALAVVWAGATGVREFVPDLRESVASARAGVTPERLSPEPLVGVVAPGDTLLSEDPSAPVLLGRTPVVLDPFMLRRIDEVHPEAVDELIDRIERGDFDHVALSTHTLEGNDFWWQHYHFGLRVISALRDGYVPVGEVDGYYLYQRGDRASPSG